MCDAVEVVRVRVAFLCLNKTVASVKVVVEEVKGYAFRGEMVCVGSIVRLPARMLRLALSWSISGVRLVRQTLRAVSGGGGDLERRVVTKGEARRSGMVLCVELGAVVRAATDGVHCRGVPILLASNLTS